MLITLSGVGKTYGKAEYVFENVNLGISFGDKIGIVGVNGSGKSTLLNILSGLDKHYDGQVNIAKSSRISILNQIVNFNSDETLYSECKKAFSYILNLEKQTNELEKLIEQKEKDGDSDDLEDLQMEYAHYLGMIQENEGFNIDYKIERILMGLGFPTSYYNRKLSTFSGGERRRAIFAKILLEDNNILILDEPTNHLDIPAIDWVIDYLKSYYGAVIIVSHDKKFLNNTVNKIFELEFGKGVLYKGNFDKYLISKEKNIEKQKKKYESQVEFIKKTEDYIRRNLEGQKTKQAQSRRKQLEKLEKIEKPQYMDRSISVKDLLKTKRSGHEVTSIENAKLGYNNKTILDNVNLKIFRNEKIAIIGNNGIGKTTLVKSITGEIKPLSGNIKLGYNVYYEYFTQNTSELNLEGDLIDFVNRYKRELTDGQIRDLLARFYFTGDKVFEEAQVLSGGEKTRLALLGLLLRESNFLLLDEPTNHLDIFMVDSLSDVMKEYPGTVLAISHDRDFIDSFSDKIIIMHPDGIDIKVGNFTDNEEFIIEKLSQGRLSDLHFRRNEDNNNKKKEKTSKGNKKRNINVYRIGKLEEEITKLEEYLEKLKNDLVHPDVVTDYKKVQEIQKEIDITEKQIDEKIKEWEDYH